MPSPSELERQEQEESARQARQAARAEVLRDSAAAAQRHAQRAAAEAIRGETEPAEGVEIEAQVTTDGIIFAVLVPWSAVTYPDGE